MYKCQILIVKLRFLSLVMYDKIKYYKLHKFKIIFIVIECKYLPL